MSLKRIWIAIKYCQLTKRLRMFFCCVALTCFAFILITSSKNENSNFINNQLQTANSKPSTVSLRHSLTASGEQSNSVLQAVSSKNEQNISISNRLNEMIHNSWSKLKNYYTNYYDNYLISKPDQQDESNLITLFHSNKFQKFNNDLNLDLNQPILQLNVSDQLKSQLDLVVRRIIENHENTYNLKNRINKNNLTINLIKEMMNKVNDDKVPLTISYTDQWQPIIGPKEKSRVYSAFYESRLDNGKFVRVIGAARTMNVEPLYCALWFIENNQLKSLFTPTISRVIRENWNLKYSAYYLLCPLIENYDVPIAVSILKRKQEIKSKDEENTDNEKDDINDDIKNRPLVFHSLGNFIIVQNNLKYKQIMSNQNKIAVCVKPLHYEYNKLDNLIEFIELNRILGIDHFLFYNHTVGPKVNCLLNQYTKNSDLITILPWHNLDMKSQEEIRTEGIFASLNDCLYRTMFRFKYVLMIDLDEYIIPNLDDNLKDLVLNRLTSSPSVRDRAGAFSFQNAFFYLQWLDDPKYSKLNSNHQENSLSSIKTDHLPVYLTTLAKTRRRATLHSHRERSKLIIVPEATIEVGNHFVSIFKI